MTITTSSVGANSASSLTKAALAKASRQAKIEAAAARTVQNLLKKANQTAVKTTISQAGMIQASAAAAGTAPQSMTAADAISASRRGKLTDPVAIIDTVANIQSSMKLLSTIASAGNISSVTMAGSGGLTIDRTVVTGALDGANPTDGTIKLLQAIDSKYTLTIDNVGAAEAVSSTFKGPSRNASLKLNVVDTAANVQTNLKAITASVGKGVIKAVAISDQKALDIQLSQVSGYSKLFSTVNGGAKLNFSDLAVADIIALGKLPTGATLGQFSISDTSKNIEAFLLSNPNTLQNHAANGKISSITVTDGKLSITSAQADANNDLLNVSFSNGKDSNPVELTVTGITVAKVVSTDASISDNTTLSLLERVSDTAKNINSAKYLLQTASKSGYIDHIAFSDAAVATFDTYEDYNKALDAVQALKGPYTLRINGLTAAQASLVEAQTSGVTLALNVKDTAANIQSNFDDLQGLAKSGWIETITSAEGNTSAISVTAEQVRKSADALSKLSGTYAIDVTGATADEVNSWRNSLANVRQFSVKDTGTNIVRSLSALETLAANNAIGEVRVTDGTVSMSGTQAMGALNVLKSKFVNDDAGAQNPNKVTLSVHSVAVNDAKTISDVFSGNTTLDSSETIVDTASSFSGAGVLDQLTLAATATNPTVSKVVVSDGGLITLNKKSDYDRLKDGLELISSSYKLKINDISFADAEAISSSATTPDNANLSFAIRDTAKNIGDNFDQLQTLAARGEIASIESSDANKQNIVIDASKIGSNATALANLGSTLNSYSISIKDASVAQALAWSTGPQAITNLASITLKDSGTNIGASLSELKSILSTTSVKFDSIVVNDGKLILNETTALNSAAFLKTEFKNGAQSGPPVEVTVDDVHVAKIDDVRNAINANATLSVKQNVKDTATNLSGTVLDKLQSRLDDGIIDKIDVSNIGTVIVADKAAFDRNADAIGKLRGIFTLKTENVSIADTTTLAASVSKLNSTSGVLAKAAFSVLDTSENISDDLAQDKKLRDLFAAGQLTALQSSDEDDKAVVVDADDLGDAYDVLKTMDASSPFALQISNALAKNASSINTMVNTLNTKMSLKAIDIKDTGANITRNIADLNTLASNLGTITVSDGSFAITEAQLTASGAFLARQFAKTDGSPVDVSITQVSASQTDDNFKVIAANGTLRTVSEDVEDTAQNVATYMADLTRAATAGSGTSLIGKIAITDNGTLEIDETSNTLPKAYKDSSTEATAQYADALKKVTGAYQMSVKGILIADLAGVATNAGNNGLRRMSYEIGDTAAKIKTALDNLKTYAAKGELSKITVSDTDPVAVTAAQAGSHLGVLKVLGSGTAVDFNDGAQALIDAKTDVLIAKTVIGASATITANDSAKPDLSVAGAKTLLIDLGATLTAGYNIKDSAVNIANQAMISGETIVSGAAAITYSSTDPVRLTQDQYNALDALVTGGTLSAMPDYTLV